MSLRKHVRAGIVVLGVAASALTFSTVGANAATASGVRPASCGTEVLGNTESMYLFGTAHIADFYLVYNSCNGNVYSQVHFFAPLTNVTGSVTLTNGVGHGAGNFSPPSPTNSLTYWGTTPISNYLDSSQTRLWYGETNFGFYYDGWHSCSAVTPTWNFSNGTVKSNGVTGCDVG